MNELQITIAITRLYSDNVMIHKMALETVTNDGGEKSHQLPCNLRQLFLLAKLT
jgi:hypothetical protein